MTDNIPAALTEVAATHGRDKLMLVFNAGMAQQAAARLYALAEKHRSTHGLHAVQILVEAFNQLATAYGEAKGWTPEDLALVERDVGLAIAGKLVGVDGKRILDA